MVLLVAFVLEFLFKYFNVGIVAWKSKKLNSFYRSFVPLARKYCRIELYAVEILDKVSDV